MQVSILSQYPAHVMRSAMVCAVNRVLCRAQWDTAMSVQWVVFIGSLVPCRGKVSVPTAGGICCAVALPFLGVG